MVAEVGTRNWFDAGGSAYALFRPEYPAGLSTFLASTVKGQGRAVDVGCGNGQLTCQLADHFTTVVGIDSSEDQIANAAKPPLSLATMPYFVGGGVGRTSETTRGFEGASSHSIHLSRSSVVSKNRQSL